MAGSLMWQYLALSWDNQRSQTYRIHRQMSKSVWTYLITWGANSDEAAYNTNSGLFDVVMPLHGGKLELDASWTQESWKTGTEFALTLPRISRARGQRYAPVIAESDDTDDWNAFLDSPRLWQAAASAFLAMYNSRFDRPWDGVVFAFETTTSDRKDQLTAWETLLARAVRTRGLDVYISSHGRTEATDNWYDSAYAYDHAALSQIADRLIYSFSGYWLPPPRSFAPYWYVGEAFDYVLNTCRVAVSGLVANMGCYSKLTGPGCGGGIEYSYTAALEFIGDAAIEWVEENDNGILRHNCAELDDGTIMWFMDGSWLQARLPLIDGRGIDTLSLFSPGRAAPDLWPIIALWKQDEFDDHPPALHKFGPEGTIRITQKVWA